MDILPTRPDESSPQSSREYICQDDEYQSLFPAIYEYLSRIKVAGKDRAPSRLVIYYEDQQCTIMLCDPATDKILFHTEEAVDLALEGLERRLLNPPVRGWKQDNRVRRR